MGREVRFVKATEFPPERFSGGCFQEALDQGIIDATADAKEVLLALDANAHKRLRVVTANDDELPRSRYVLLSIRQPRDAKYIINYSYRLMRNGWKLFLNHGAFLTFVSGAFREVLPVSCDEVSIPLQLGGKLQAMTVKLGGRMPLVDLHPLAYAPTELGPSPLIRGENVLVLR